MTAECPPLERKENVPVSGSSWLTIPFYKDPNSSDYTQAVDRFVRFIDQAKQRTGLNLVVVDDGSGVTLERLGGVPDRLIQLPVNSGKACAVRVGLEALLNDSDANMGLIVQYDGDGDQSFVDIPSVYERLIEVSGGNSEKPILVIGDRYSEGLIVAPNPDSVAYRQSILIFFGAISRGLGHDENVRDWVSGARGYTRAYAEEFLAMSKSGRYGVESEQLVTASLIGAKVATAPLTISRPRDTNTLTSKWLQNLEVYKDHEEALRYQGKGQLVGLMQRLASQLREEKDDFYLDLTSIGETTLMHFMRQGDRYTAEIPAEHRARIFVPDADFPFTLQRPGMKDN